MIVLAHNHQSRVAKASQGGIQLTKHPKQALALIDVSLLEQFNVGRADGGAGADLAGVWEACGLPMFPLQAVLFVRTMTRAVLMVTFGATCCPVQVSAIR